MKKETKKKSKFTPKLAIMVGLVVLASLIACLVVFLDSDDLMTIFRYIRRITFIVAIPILILCIFWKAIRKLGLIWFLWMIVVGIVGQVVDYVTRKEAATPYHHVAEGRVFGDYGLRVSEEDYRDYNKNESHQKVEKLFKGENK